MAPLQVSHGFSAMVTPSMAGKFVRAKDSLQVSHGFSTMETTDLFVTMLAVSDASSEPRLLCNGNPHQQPTSPMVPRPASNEQRLLNHGNALDPRHHAAHHLTSNEPRLLNHGNAGQAAFDRIYRVIASNEPGFSTMKTRASLILTSWTRSTLQMSHGFSAMETALYKEHLCWFDKLQMSHGFSAMETLHGPRGEDHAADTSSEPRLLSHGNTGPVRPIPSPAKTGFK